MSEFIEGLNPEQQEAVLATEGPVLLLAGAGSGKTRVLTRRIAHLVRNHGADPSEVFAVTFTNKAAGEMRNRVRSLLGPDAAGVWVSTFHSACVKILRAHADSLGRDRNFIIYDDKEQLDIIKKVVLALNLDADYYQPRAVAGFLDKAKNDGISPADMARSQFGMLQEKIPIIYQAYQEELLKNNAMDFGDLLLETLNLFDKAPEVLNKYNGGIKYVMVDEYQDTNRVQYLLVKALTSVHKNLCVVGDDDQSIYSWRGADIRNILEFHRDFPGAKVIKLEQNYRSTKNILEAAQRVVEKNRKRTAKTLWTDNVPGDLIALYTAEDDRDEVRTVVEHIRREQKQHGLRLRDMAVMYRMNSLSRVMEEGLLQAKIPYQVVGGVKFYDRREVKDVLAVLRLFVNPMDSMSFRRVVENFTKGIGKASLDKIESFARGAGQDLLSAPISAINAGALGGAAGNKVRVFAELLQAMYAESSNLGIRELTIHILEKSGYLGELKRQNTEEARSRVENLGELLSSMEEYEEAHPDGALPEYLDQVALVADVDTIEEVDQITLMTLHSAKGLEYPIVFLIGMEQNVFPHSRSKGDPLQLEEERRLCYVGITRAEKRLYLSHSKRRRLWGDYEMFHPSQFLGDIPPNLLKRTQPAKPAWLDVPPTEGKYQKVEYDAGHSTAAVADPVSRQMDSKVGKFRQGCKVSHPTFGVGLVVYAEGDADNPKLTVKFDGGVKKIMARYVPLEVVG